jgi:hypothetical protein
MFVAAERFLSDIVKDYEGFIKFEQIEGSTSWNPSQGLSILKTKT